MSNTVPVASSSDPSSTDAAFNDTVSEYLVLCRTFENVLKKPEDDDAEAGSDSTVGQIGKSVAETIARVVTGFGE